jgi:hypothetical protein
MDCPEIRVSRDYQAKNVTDATPRARAFANRVVVHTSRMTNFIGDALAASERIDGRVKPDPAAGKRYPLPAPDFHRLDHAGFAWRSWRRQFLAKKPNSVLYSFQAPTENAPCPILSIPPRPPPRSLA